MADSRSDVIVLVDSDDGGSECAAKWSPAGGGEAPSSQARRGSSSQSVIDVDASDLENDGQKSQQSSSSSSASSGIPSPFKGGAAAMAAAPDRPPSIIHTKSPAHQSEPAKKKGLTNANETIHMDEESDAGMSNAKESLAAKPPAKKPPRKKRQWGKRRNAAKSSDSASCASSVPSSVRSKSVATHFHCYLLRSLNPDHPLKTYIGFTTHPQRRIRQHNGELKNAGAWRTKRSGRPWTFVCVVHGFQDKIAALQFEWAWQNVHKSKAFREAVGCDKLAKKMKRRYGPKARLDELRILIRECLPFSLYSLTVFFPEREYYDIFRGILSKNAKGNDGESDALGPLTNIEVCALENMPVAKESAAARAKKKAAREARKAQEQKKKAGVSGPNASDWPESASSAMEEESCWSDMLDDDDDDTDPESKRNNLKTIQEIDSSIDFCSSSNDGNSKSSASGSKEMRLDNNGSVDDISETFLSLSLDGGSQKPSPKTVKDSDDLSTISSKSDCSLNTNPDNEVEIAEKENQRADANVSKDCSVVDLCDSP